MEEKTRRMLISVFSFIIGVVFIVDGIVKLFGLMMPMEVISLREYPLWLINLVSIVELGSGILFLVEEYRFYGAFLGVISSIFGMIYGFGSQNYLTLTLPVLFFLGSWIIGWSIMPKRLLKKACSLPVFRMTHACRVSHRR